MSFTRPNLPELIREIEGLIKMWQNATDMNNDA